MSTKEDGRALRLMKAMGSTQGFTPLPPAQHHWQIAMNQPPLYRIWSWMVKHTCHWSAGPEKGSPYAVDDEGKELHIEHLAADLFNGNVGNAQAYWREGGKLGLWRKGSKKDGLRRLYFNGELKPEASDDPEQGEEKVNPKLLYRSFPAYLLLQLNDLPDERLDAFVKVDKPAFERWQGIQAGVIEGLRVIADREEDSRFAAFGLEKRRIEREKSASNGTAHSNGNGAHAAARDRVLPLLPEIETVVQKFETLYKVEEKTLYEESNGAVQSDFGGATLLPADHRGKARVLSSAGSSDARGGPSKTHPHDARKHGKYLHTDDAADVAASEPQTPAENTALEMLFSEIGRMQESFKHADFGRERVSRERKSDRVTLLKILRQVGADHVLSFCFHIADQFRGLDRNGLAKLPPRSPDDPHGPRSLGLIWDWAKRWSGTRVKEAKA